MAKYCAATAKFKHIGFLEATRVNKNTCTGRNGEDVHYLQKKLVRVFDEFVMNNKTHIFLAYNSDNHFVFILVNLAKTKIEVWDSKKKPLSHLDPLVDVLNSVRKYRLEASFVPFKVEVMDLTHLEQTMGNNECGFYVMWVMLQYVGGKAIKQDQFRKRMNHNWLLDSEIVALQGELAKFITDEVVSKKGLFSIARSVQFAHQYRPYKINRLL